MTIRDEFPRTVIDTLAKRVGTLCSNPQCSTPTYGPNDNISKSSSKGVAAHITAAASGGPRYDASMTPAARRHIDNGIWLCEACAKLIDTDDHRYSVEILKRWKSVAEARARKAMENPRIVNVGPDFADSVLLVFLQKSVVRLDQPRSGVRIPQKITIHPLKAHRTLSDVQIPVAMGPPLEPPESVLIWLNCQNQGTGVDQHIKFGVRFKDSRPGVIRTEVGGDAVSLRDGGRQGASFASFYVRDLLPNEVASAKVFAQAGMDFEAHLWTQNAGASPEVFVYEMLYGEPEVVTPVRLPVATPGVGRNDPCPCGSGKKFKRCHGT